MKTDKYNEIEKVGTEKVCKSCSTSPCPLCTKEGLIMMVIGFLLVISGNVYLKIVGFGVIILAYAIPLIKFFKNKK